eukprot:CAMPEP_0170774688 /NCGR_PEP_ID=MMETSP0733-20121128/10109_1 /TAXON_ID=186038 /ORGANISM="Fragilariopsis kerguelensis, Strain L26-C5" /LENGTH=712 /DNA_ID=CAMNT_0011117297 /DNA_START=70 /DNA_END=2208 /DNA_ORIENTATION=+
MEAMDIPDSTYDKHHQYELCGETLVPPPPLIIDTVIDIDDTNGNNETPWSNNDDDDEDDLMVTVLDKSKKKKNGSTRRSIHSVYLAAGIHHQVTPTDLGTLPRRFEAGSVKARMTWFGALCISGIGMFVEAYIIITTGQLKTIWHAMYPACWSEDDNVACPNLIKCCGLYPNTPLDETTGQCAVNIGSNLAEGEIYDVCDPTTGDYNAGVLCDNGTLQAISYTEFAGLMIGMLSFGFIGDCMGLKNAGILAALLSVIGVVIMCLVDLPDNLNIQFILYALFFGIFGLGVGGEYPLTAMSAAAHSSESAEEAAMDNSERRCYRLLRDKERTARRGETIGLVFSMQGIGAVVGSLFLLVLIYFSNQLYTICDRRINPGVNSQGVVPDALNTVWRAFLFIGLIFHAMVLLYRWLIVEENEEGMETLKKRKAKRKAEHKLTLRAVFGFYGFRVISTAGCWFLWDVAFYGLKLFSGPIFDAINPDGGLLVNNGYLLLNNVLALIGYYGCSMIIDKPTIGRKNVQLVFFILVSIDFLILSFFFTKVSPGVLIFLYFLSSILGQFVNVTTYVMAAEAYPSELRGTLHGLSAFTGKLGALIATIVFGVVDTETIFLICGITGFIGAFLTFLFSADMTCVSFAEHDAQLELYLEGRIDVYRGKLNEPKHLSLFERLTGNHGEYDPTWAKEFIQREESTRSEDFIDSVREEETGPIEDEAEA